MQPRLKRSVPAWFSAQHLPLVNVRNDHALQQFLLDQSQISLVLRGGCTQCLLYPKLGASRTILGSHRKIAICYQLPRDRPSMVYTVGL